MMHLVQILKDDYELLVTDNGIAAILMAKEHVPDLIILDIIMPEINGYETLERLKAAPETRDIPVIFITSLDEEADEEKGLSLGAVDYITKPFSATIVKLRVNQQIRIANQINIIRRLSMMDHLTGIPNRRFFDRRLHEEWERAIRNGSDIGLMILDVDHFKDYNDTYGHQQGDAALIALSNALSRCLHRPGDFAARWGGEEFAVLLPETDEAGVLHIASVIRMMVEDTIIPNGMGANTRITVSIGVNVEHPARNASLDKFISYADASLYRAKRNGRNRVEVHAGDGE
jgi:diguanylate cyclase (GGDEF)-like protein